MLRSSLRRPVAVAPLAPDLLPSLTTPRARHPQTRPDACVTCHGTINPLGFSLEHFDAVGVIPADGRGRPDRRHRDLPGPRGRPSQRRRPRPRRLLAGSDEAQTAFVEQFFHSLVKQPIRAFGPDTPAGPADVVRLGNCVRKLMGEGRRCLRLAAPE